MILLLDIGNTHTHLGLADGGHVTRQTNIPTAGWQDGRGERFLKRFLGNSAKRTISGTALCCVVPRVVPRVRRIIAKVSGLHSFELTSKTARGVGINYPSPATIGADRLANAIAVKERYGAPAVVVDFGTAVTFDVVDRAGDYVGGIIAPGLAVMTEYMHEKTALLPRIKIREVRRVVGKSTEQAMLSGAVHGYRGLVRELLLELKQELNAKKLPVVATGSYAELIAAKLPEITAVEPLLTLEGLLLAFENQRADKRRPRQIKKMAG
ncbi:MAG TPA: type III pantothenate kinase [Candidatus Dormibacteraeota bacterium]|nr:type III pantothenate kinase [Candidatus Dormibacteraeota bacterium]